MERIIWEYAGICGVDPNPLTLRQLEMMAVGRMRTDWDRMAAMLATYINAHVPGGGARPDELNPFRKAPKVLLKGKAAIAVVKQLIERQNESKRSFGG